MCCEPQKDKIREAKELLDKCAENIEESQSNDPQIKVALTRAKLGCIKKALLLHQNTKLTEEGREKILSGKLKKLYASNLARILTKASQAGT